MVVAITRRDRSAAELRALACRSDDADQARRLLALALVLDGEPREAAAKAAGMTRQTLRDWVHRYNDEGVEALRDRPKPGRPPILSPEDLAALDALLEEGPDIAVHGVVRWRCFDLKAVIAARFGAAMSERSVGRVLNRRGFRRLSVRPRHPRTDEAAQEAFKKTSPRP